MRQLECTKCGWKSELYPDGSLFAGPGGTLSCPACEKTKRNGPGIEMSYGSVHSIDVPPFKGWKISQSRRQHLIHYFSYEKPVNEAICGAKISSEGVHFLLREHWEDSYSAESLRHWGKKFCPKCEKKLKVTKNE